MKKEAIKIEMKPSHPGAFIKTEVLDELGLSVTKAAEVLDVRRATLSDLVNEKAALSPEMALRLKKAFHLNMAILLRMQAWYDAIEMRKQAGKSRLPPMCRLKCGDLLHNIKTVAPSEY
ncbi:MAG: HigA family addiction module antitoxin [Nitrospirales bacterium]